MSEKHSPDSPAKQRVRPKLSWRATARIGGFILFFALGLGVGYVLWGFPLATARSEVTQLRADIQASSSAASQGAAAVEAAADGEIQQVTRYPVVEDDDPVYGPDNAPITIIEFSDFECPYCKTWHDQVWTRLKELYPDQVRLVYRDFPLYSIHPNAGPAANAANCANEEDQYWAFHELLFSGDQKLGTETYLNYAREIGLNIAAFEQCLSENRYEAEVTADYEYAVGIGIQSTPTFFVNGIALIGAQPFEVFQEVIELELAGKLSK